MDRIGERVYVHRVYAMGFDTVAAVVLTATRAIVFDTLLSAQAMAPVRELLGDVAGRRRIVVVNSHHHWDHVWGNAAFPGCEIVAHSACPRLMIAQSRAASPELPPEPPEGIVVPTITFDDRLEFVDEMETVQLIHAPGHTEDSIVLYLEPERLLLAGDAAEWPLPTLRPARRLRRLHAHARACSGVSARRRWCPHTGRRWTRRSSTPTSATSASCSRRSPS